MSHIWMSHVTHMNESCQSVHVHECGSRHTRKCKRNTCMIPSFFAFLFSAFSLCTIFCGFFVFAPVFSVLSVFFFLVFSFVLWIFTSAVSVFSAQGEMSRTWMSHVSWHITWMSHATHTREDEKRGFWAQRDTRHVRIDHVTWRNESCHTYQWVVSHLWMSPVSHTREDGKRVCSAQGDMSHVCMSHVTCMNESCHMHEWDLPSIWMSHVTHVLEDRTYMSSAQRDMSHTSTSNLTHFLEVRRNWWGQERGLNSRENHWYLWHDSFLRVTWLILTCDMTHSYVWHDSFLRVTW